MSWNVASGHILHGWAGRVVHSWLFFCVAIWSLAKDSEEAGDGLLLQLESMKVIPLEIKILLAAVCSLKKDSEP